MVNIQFDRCVRVPDITAAAADDPVGTFLFIEGFEHGTDTIENSFEAAGGVGTFFAALQQGQTALLCGLVIAHADQIGQQQPDLFHTVAAVVQNTIP